MEIYDFYFMPLFLNCKNEKNIMIYGIYDDLWRFMEIYDDLWIFFWPKNKKK